MRELQKRIPNDPELELELRRLKFVITLEKEIIPTFYKDMRSYLSDAYYEFER
jgi:hypothetical protein